MSFSENIQKYRPYPPVRLQDRIWPDQVLDKPPIWCSVDLRDGNQALINPMNVERKKRLFKRLVQCGFTEIEAGFPSASQTDFDFFRHLIENNLVPEGVTLQALTQSRPELIERTFESLKGAPRAIVHLYNSTSELQRRVVFKMDRDGVRDIALRGTEQLRDLARKNPETEWVLEYSPESFTGTELDYAVDVSNAVMDIWEPTPEHRAIVNLPATVEMSTPNVYADQIEWMIREFKNRDSLIVSLHPHNDRGTATAAAELALLAGADRVEGTLFGNGERTGNVDLVNLAINLFTQGVDPGLDFSDINAVRRDVEYCNDIPVPVRHPWVGDLVFTAFSGSHQDAIKKGLLALRETNNPHWEVPYLPIDPSDLNRQYEPIIRVNSQSGKAGVAFMLEADYGLVLPRIAQVEFSGIVQEHTDQSGTEVTPQQVYQLFCDTYLKNIRPYEYLSHEEQRHDSGEVYLTVTLRYNGEQCILHGSGNGPVSAMVDALCKHRDHTGTLHLDHYSQHALEDGAKASAACYVALESGPHSTCGIAIGGDTQITSLCAVLSAYNRLSSQLSTD